MLKSAPITELGLTVQFSPAAALTIVDAAELVEHFRPRFPHFDEIPRAGPMTYVPGVIVESPIGSLPRMRISSPDRSRAILVQEDRVTYAWVRTSSLRLDPEYPGFEAILSEAKDVWREFSAWLERKLPVELAPAVCEIGYVDQFEAVDPSGAPIRMSSIFAFLNPNLPPMRMGLCSYTWVEPMSEQEGFTQVNINGIVHSDDGVPILNMTTTSAFQAGRDWGGLESQFLSVRGVVSELFQRVVIQPGSPK